MLSRENPVYQPKYGSIPFSNHPSRLFCSCFYHNHECHMKIRNNSRSWLATDLTAAFSWWEGQLFFCGTLFRLTVGLTHSNIQQVSVPLSCTENWYILHSTSPMKIDIVTYPQLIFFMFVMTYVTNLFTCRSTGKCSTDFPKAGQWTL